jgi:hypothetical protein
MSTTPFFIAARRRRLGRGKPRPTVPPPVQNQIAGVVYGPAPETLVVTVTGSLLALDNLPGVMALEIDENMYNPIDADLDELPQVTLTFERDVTTATAWTVPTPAAWEFAEGELAAPFSGAID